METCLNEETVSEMSQELNLKLKLTGDGSNEDDYASGEEYHEDDEDEEFSFAFAFDEVNTEQISAEEAFDNGQIKPVFPLFNRDLLLAEGEDLESFKLNDRLPNVKMVFVEANGEPNDSSSTTGDDEIAGPYCDWSKKEVEVEVAAEHCKKSNSTGFSKIWRFKDLMHRSNSDGRDAFVFLNNTAASGSASVSVTDKREEKVSGKVEKKEGSSENKIYVGEGKVNGDGGVGGGVKVKKVVKGKKVALSPHEVYMRSKAKEGRRSYLPYRPELVGFFTSVNGGSLTRNVHPF